MQCVVIFFIKISHFLMLFSKTPRNTSSHQPKKSTQIFDKKKNLSIIDMIKYLYVYYLAMEKKLLDLTHKFKILSNEDKKNKLLSMLDMVKDHISFVPWLIEFIHNKEVVGDEFLEKNYTILMTIALQNQEKMFSEETKKNQTIKESIQKKYENEHLIDQNEAELLLNNVAF